jgi:serpin B
MKSILTLMTCLVPLMIYEDNPEELIDGNNRFAFKLFHEMQGNTRENLFYSPFSISTAIAMVYAGARDETALQMSRVMNSQPADC